jgi:hypothetical protein
MSIIQNMDVQDRDVGERLFAALGEQLGAAGVSFDLVVIGGSALLALGLIARPTRDVDLVALLTGRTLTDPRPLPGPLAAARDRVARDFGLPDDWLNPGPAALLDFGLPDGFVDRLERRSYGPALRVHYASRLDQIHLKLYAAADGRSAKHEADLRALQPTRDELLAAARWTRTHDPSQGFREELLKTLAALGVADAALDV